MSAGTLRPLLDEDLNVGHVRNRIVFRKNLSSNVNARTVGLFFEQKIENNAAAFINQVTISECRTAQFGYRLRPRIKNKRSNDVCHNCSPNSLFSRTLRSRPRNTDGSANRAKPTQHVEQRAERCCRQRPCRTPEQIVALTRHEYPKMRKRSYSRPTNRKSASIPTI